MVKSASAHNLRKVPDLIGQWDTDVAPPVEQQIESKVRFSDGAKVAKPREVDLEIEYSEMLFTIEPGLLLRAHTPLKLGYYDDEGVLEVLGWDINVPLGESGILSDKIARRFLELFSRSQSGTLAPEEALRFSQICSQVDYRGFCSSRRLPRWEEAWLVRKEPACYLDFGTGEKTKLAAAPTRSLNLLSAGDYFGAWFTTNREGEITDIKNIELRPDPNSSDEMIWPESKPVEFDPELKSMLPDPNPWPQEE